MYKYDRKELIRIYNNGLALRGRIEEIIDRLWLEGIQNICWLGIGGTWASCMQAAVHMKEKTSLDVFVENAGEYLVTGNRRIGKGTLVVISSVSGTTQEMAAAVEKVQKAVFKQPEACKIEASGCFYAVLTMILGCAYFEAAFAMIILLFFS